ncbi:hypothetical protein PFISCL1PPCAC_20329 [Pristionchus fissidentatus]|uniref:Protein kinase domain-containing protein n=1 Tax=Pristionchus fissidentatus TaxID=1538716 RepID=A0AAV5WB21_9BILA|nr:hypothetical protein PFISCL1PPCAC_20329 [Pristionchus fissidentatus]
MSAENNPQEEDDKKEDGGVEDDLKKALESIHDELDDMECYHGNMLEEDMKAAVQRDGDFLLRTKMMPDGSKRILLTVKFKGEILDIRLRAKSIANSDPPKYLFSFDNKTMRTAIKDIMDKHRMNTPVLWRKESVMLLNLVARSSWELKKDHLTLEKKIGEGAFGEVHSGKLKYRFPEGPRTINVAVKVIKRSANNEKATTELQKEGALMRRFKHENVVKMYGMVFERDSIMVVMELVNGGGLNDYVKKNKVSPDEKSQYALDIANGLSYIHSLHCIHRDIACRNCLLDVKGKGNKIAKVSDFGLTRQTEMHRVTTDEKIPIRWIAPEVLRTYEYTRAADIYAYAILVWEIFSNGAMPFENMTNAQIKEGIKDTAFRPIFPSGTPADIMDTIGPCWDSEPAARPELKEVIKKLWKYNRRSNGNDIDTGCEASNPPDGGLPRAGNRARSNESKKTDRRSKKIKSKEKNNTMKSTKK